MEQYFIAAILVYGLFLLFYLLSENKKCKANKTRFRLFPTSQKDDIIGKSKFDLRQHRTNATILINNKKEVENALIFVCGNSSESSPAIPSEELELIFSTNPTASESENISKEIDVEIENISPEKNRDEESDEVDDLDFEETDGTDEAAGTVSFAVGVDFDNLAGMVQTVDNKDTASRKNREEAGRVLVELRQTDMFEQLVSEKPQKEVVITTLMDEYMAAFQKKKKECELLDESTVKAPEDFNPRNFA